jgi:hypothetical protein
VPTLESWLLALTITGLPLGGLGIWWARTGRGRSQVVFGNTLFLCTLLCLGVSSLVAAFHLADGLIPIGLAAGLLVIAMLWDLPQAEMLYGQAKGPRT